MDTSNLIRNAEGEFECPICKRPMIPIGPKGEWVCLIALEAQKRGLIGKPGVKHDAVYIWTEVRGNE